MKDIIDRIHKLTIQSGKSPGKMFASILEELGELARAIKIEEGVLGNKNKKLDEPSYSECVDLFICIVSYHITNNGNTDEIRPYDNNHMTNVCGPEVKFLLLKQFSGSLVNWGVTLQLHDCYRLYHACGGTAENFVAICDSKLDKWESQIKKEIQCTE